MAYQRHISVFDSAFKIINLVNDRTKQQRLLLVQGVAVDVGAKRVRKLVGAYAPTGTDTDIKPISPPHR